LAVFMTANPEASAQEVSFGLRSQYHFENLTFREGTGVPSETDQDFSQYLNLDTRGAGLKNLATSFLLRWEWDMDGTALDSPFRDHRDAFSGRQQLRFLRGYAELPDALPHVDVRVGRQTVFEAETFLMDGGLFQLKELGGLDITAFVGNMVLFFLDPSQDVIFGGSVTHRPFESTRLRLSNVKYIDNTLEVSVFQEFTEAVDFSAAFALLDDDARHLSLSAGYTSTRIDTSVLVNVFKQFQASFFKQAELDFTAANLQGRRDISFARLFIGQLQPFWQYQVRVAQRLVQRLTLEASFTLREVSSTGNEDAFNADFFEFSVGLQLRDWPFTGFVVTPSFNRRELQRHAIPAAVAFDDIRGEGETRVQGFTLDLSQRLFRNALRVGATIGYQLFDVVSRFQRVEGLNSFGGSGFIEWHFSKQISVKLRYRRENDLKLIFPDVAWVEGLTFQVVGKF